MNRYLSYCSILVLSVSMIFSSCKKDIDQTPINENPITDMGSLKVDESFNWNTTRPISLHLEARTNDNQPMKKLRMFVYRENPGEGETFNPSIKSVFSGFTDANGVLDATLVLPSFITKVWVTTNYIGLPSLVEVSVVNGIASRIFGGMVKSSGAKSLYSRNIPKPLDGSKSSYLTLGSWNTSGYPSYLTTNDVISSDLLADINASLPEQSQLPNSHPQYLVSGNQANIVLKDSCDLWVTFVHEGAGYKNVLGYYTYTKGNEPQSVNDLSNMTIIFPNVSFSGSGGMLSSGNKVHIGSFAANTVIGYFIIANGFSNGTISSSAPVYYSNTALNPEADAAKKQHMVMLNDTERDLLILGFEDINRGESGCDHDFNDAVFYVTANPITAIETEDVPEIDTPEDADGDGVSDRFDDFPTDPDVAVNNYYPGEGEFGTLAFEDLWPSCGDYDFNDLVLDYQFNQITNSDNKVVKVKAKLVVRAIGAGYHNGFGFQMDLLPSDVSSVTGCDLRYNYITVLANGCEQGHTKATIVAFDNAFNVLPSAGGTYVNTVVGNAYVVPDTQLITITLNTPKSIDQVGYAPYNPFLIANKVRGKEIHLPGYPPTALANASLFGTEDDQTNIANGNYYKSFNNLPWAMNLPSSFVYPKEKSSIVQAHLRFGNWAQSNGFSYMDWYMEKLGYRDNTHVYSH